MVEFVTNSPEETSQVAADLAQKMLAGTTVALFGNLGSGKTVFVKAIAKALGVKDNLTSPTFVLLRAYEADYGTIKQFVHVDCYRLEAKENLSDIGLDDYIDDKLSLVAIEWADKIRELPPGTTRVNIEYLSDTKRKIRIED